MSELLKSVDTWFLIFLVVLLGGWFVWSVKRIFSEFGDAVKDLRSLIRELFEKHNDIDARLCTLEGEHKALSCQVKSFGRRSSDGIEPSPRFE